jgi:GT2 family glycosyltransferase
MVLNWNGEAFLRPCLDSLAEETCKHVEVLLIDNGSKDRSVETVSREYPCVRVVAHTTNMGFSRGYDAAAPDARGDYLVFLNNDTVVRKGWLVPLIDGLQESAVGITTSKILFYGLPLIQAAGGKLKLWTGPWELGYGSEQDSFDGPCIEPFFACGAAMAMPRWLFDKLGGFDPSFFAYCEDLDISWRARLAGYKVRLASQSVVYHHYAASHGALNAYKVRMVTENYLATMVKCLSAPNLAHSLPAYLAFIVVKGATVSVLKRKPAYLGQVVVAIANTVRNLPELLRRRRRTQAQRVTRERDVLRSYGFGLLDSPGTLFRAYRLLDSVRPPGKSDGQPER